MQNVDTKLNHCEHNFLSWTAGLTEQLTVFHLLLHVQYKRWVAATNETLIVLHTDSSST